AICLVPQYNIKSGSIGAARKKVPLVVVFWINCLFFQSIFHKTNYLYEFICKKTIEPDAGPGRRR
ncbi:MAG TPA: hypothetical protein PLY26_09565, partial [Ferruginibacter sp.]|nr:hypothetical protein [Ferruginibacter sp.]